jgi:thiaminase/transcriptional activator TenA
MRLSEQLWESIAAVFKRIVDHPFLRELADGTLDPDSFRFYVVQDALYLRAFARALSVAAARAPHQADTLMFNQHAGGAVEVERSLHESFFSDFGMTETEVESTPMAPTNLAYTSYLLSVAYGGSFAEGLSAVLPCYWIYWEVGKALIQRGSSNPLYQRWIDTYGGEEFGAIVNAVLALTDRIGEDISPSERAKMREHFVATSRYEWMFWEMGYTKEQWPL